MPELPIVTDGILSSEPQVLPQHHTNNATSVYMGNIQNIQTIIRPYKMNINMGEVTLCPKPNSTVHNVHI